MITEQLLENRICTKSGKEFSVTQADADFYKKVSPKFGEYVAEIPFPTLCPEERQKRRMAFRNERKLYRRMCDATKQPIISIYSPDKPYKIYAQKTWRSDSWDALEFARVFDFWKTFTEQFDSLMKSVPRISIMNDDGVWSENCGYCQDFAFGKNCYMCTWSRHLEESFYSHFEACDSTHLVDCISIAKSHHCYECCYCSELYNCAYLERSTGCTDCLFGFELVWCSDCIACYWLQNQQYCYQNKQLSKEEYEEVKLHVMRDLNTVHDVFLEHLEKSWVRKNAYYLHCDDCSWEYLFHCRNVKESYWTHNSSHSKYLFGWDQLKECHDIVISWWLELWYEGVTPDNWYKVCFSTFSWKCTNCYYTDLCQSCTDCFGCVWLRNKQYCIFNKQYTKEEYNELMPKIIEHMKWTEERWEFFDPTLSPWWINETIAHENYPCDQVEAEKNGFNRSLFVSPHAQSDKIIEGRNLPTSTVWMDDSILRYAIRCSETWKLFRLQAKEFSFYVKHGLPVPSVHPDERYRKLMMRR